MTQAAVDRGFDAFTPFFTQSFYLMIAWGALNLLAFISFGQMLRRILGFAQPISAGLAATWGIAFCTTFGGLACVLGIAKTPVLIGLVMLGAGLRVVSCWRSFRLRPNVSVLPLTILGAVLFLANVHAYFFNGWDDYVGYFPMIRHILETGTLIDPFSVRRASTLGGQSFLQAMSVSVAGFQAGFMFERGICAFILCLLLSEELCDRIANPTTRLITAGFFGAAILLNQAITTVNTSSITSSLLMALSLYFTAEYLSRLQQLGKIRGILFMAGLGASATREPRSRH